MQRLVMKPTGVLLCSSILLLAACASSPLHQQDSEQSVSIGPYAAFTGRLIVIEPKRRWQVLLKWKAEKPANGWLRITHAATGTVVEFRWQNSRMEIRDNQHPGWRQIGQQQLGEQGIVLPPQQLAAILLNRMPAHFKQKKNDTWESLATGGLIRLQWQPDNQKLIMTDMKHGRKATLIIQP